MTAPGKPATSIRTRIETRSIPEPMSGCWLWLGTINRAGYGTLTVGSRTDGTRRRALAHRISYEVFRGSVRGLCVCHSCDNAFCVNPDHLFLGTQADNVRDMQRKGRKAILLGENNPSSKLSRIEVAAIRKMLADGETVGSIARFHGVTKQSIWAISSGKCWKLPQNPHTNSNHQKQTGEYQRSSSDAFMSSHQQSFGAAFRAPAQAPGPSLATGMSRDPANAGGCHEEAVTPFLLRSAFEKRSATALEQTSLKAERAIDGLKHSGTAPGACAPERDIFGGANLGSFT